MREEVKVQWLIDLRGDEYQQGRGCLVKRHRDSKGVETLRHCCLGVLTDQAVKAGIGRWVKSEETPDRLVYEAPDGRTDRAYLPKAVAEWAGMSTTDPYGSVPIPSEGYSFVSDTLASRNDYGTPFTGIADIIEEKL
jgi:hypothetical protein